MKKSLYRGVKMARSEIVDKYSYLLNEAQELVNDELKAKFERGEIESPYGESGSWLDIIQIFDYTLPYWSDNTVLQELDWLLLLIKVYDLRPEAARSALKLICGFILVTETLYFWYEERRPHLLNRLQKYFPLDNKDLNYDYLRYVYNYSDYYEVIIS